MTTAYVIIGSYERLVLAYRVVLHNTIDDHAILHDNGTKANSASKQDDDGLIVPDGTQCFLPLFSNGSHLNSVKDVAISMTGKYAASASTDERLNIFDLERKRELGLLFGHSSALTAVKFCGDQYLMSASEDGDFLVWNCKTWELAATMKTKAGGIHSLSLHPSGKLALSVGSDRKLRMWNLIERRLAFTLKLAYAPTLLSFTTSGNCYYMLLTNQVDFFDSNTCSLQWTFSCKHLPGVILSAATCFIRDLKEQVILGSNDGRLCIANIPDKCLSLTWYKIGDARIKALATVSDRWILTGSSSGALHLWQINGTAEHLAVSCVATVDTGVRITCISAAIPSISSAHKQSKQRIKRRNATMAAADLNGRDSVSVDKAAKKKRIGKGQAQ